MKRPSFLLAVLLPVAIAAPAAAGDHHAPRATLRVEGEVQKGLIHHADGWSRPSKEPGFCDVTFATGFPTFRRALRHSPGDEIVVRLHKAAAPVEVEVQRWPRVNDKGHAAGTPTPLPWLLRPRIAQGAIRAWEIVVLPPVIDGHLYLGVGAYWRDEDGCSQEPDLGSQYAAWTFHLKGR